jgi:hypothetical protein
MLRDGRRSGRLSSFMGHPALRIPLEIARQVTQAEHLRDAGERVDREPGLPTLDPPKVRGVDSCSACDFPKAEPLGFAEGAERRSVPTLTRRHGARLSGVNAIANRSALV